MGTMAVRGPASLVFLAVLAFAAFLVLLAFLVIMLVIHGGTGAFPTGAMC